MKNFGKIVGINLVVVLVYSLLIRLLLISESNHDRGMGIVMLSAFAVGIHVVVCGGAAIMFFSSSKREAGRNWLATMGIVLLVGFSVCLGNASLG